MKVNSQVEAIICIDSFKTIDLLLLQEGMYQLRISLYFHDEIQGIKVPLIPRETFDMATQSQLRTSYKPKQQIPVPSQSIGHRDRTKTSSISQPKGRDWIPAHILKEYNMFCTSAFLIRTWTEEEKIQIQNGCRFSAQIQQKDSRMPMFLEIELMYNDLSNHNEQLARFKCIAISKFKISEVTQGVFEYIPVIFSDEHFHLVNMCIYATLTEFKIQIPKHLQPDESPIISAFLSQMQSQKLDLKQQVGNYTLNFQLKQIKDLYTGVIQPIRDSYEALSDFYVHLDLEERKSTTPAGGSHFQKAQRSTVLLPLSSYHTLERQFQVEKVEGKLSFNSLQYQDIEEQKTIHFARTIAIEYQTVQSMVQQLWQKMQQLIKQKNYQFIKNMKVQSLHHQQQRYQQFISKEVLHLLDHTYAVVPNTHKIKLDQQECNQRRTQTADRIFGPSRVLDLKLEKELKDKFVLLQKHFVIKQQPASERSTQLHSRGKLHLIIFVHGYQGHPFDMRLIENYLCLRHPQHMFMISICNQNGTEGDILKMGIKLAQEVKDFVVQWCPETCLARLSFVAHSLGGLIVRAALPYLQQYSDKMHTLLTLGSPHLGYVHNKHGLIKFGLWMLQVFKKSQCLQQLTMEDSSDQEELTMMKLSKMIGLSWFKNVILIGSKQDHYVTSDSSLIMKVDSQQNDIHNFIAHNVLQNFTQTEIIRVSIDFNFEDGDLDTFLGRKAHIAILGSHFLLQYIVYNLGGQFN